MRSVSWSPGWREFTVTPSPAISRASVFRNAVRPERATFERMRPAIGWRTPIDVIATTLPHRCVAHRGHRRVAHRDVREAVELDGLLVRVDRRASRSCRAADRRRCTRGCRSRPSRPGAACTNAAAPASVETSATSGTASGPISAAAASIAPATGRRWRRCTPSSASALAVARPEPARRGRHRGPPSFDAVVHAVTSVSAHLWMGPSRRAGRCRCARCARR